MLKTIYNLYIKRAQLKIDIGENNNMIVEKNLKKVFTKKESNNIIKKNYNPLNKDCKIFEREGSDMKEKDIVLEEIEKELTIKEKEIIKSYPDICIKLYRRGMLDCFNYYNK